MIASPGGGSWASRTAKTGILICSLLGAWLSLAQTSPATRPDVKLCTPGLVFAIAQQDDGKIIIGGYFSLVGGEVRHNIARLNADGSLDKGWNPGADAPVMQIVVNGSEVFVAGDFDVIGGQPRNGLAKLSTSGNGTPDPLWNPSHPGQIHSLALSGTNLFVGGGSYLARFGTEGTGAGESPWGPQPDNRIVALLADGTNLYVAGSFSQLGAFSRQRLARISTLGAGTVDPVWDPNVTGGNGGSISGLAATGSYLYIGGSFDVVGGVPRENIARLSLESSGMADPNWNPGAHGDIVYALSVSGGAVYVAGYFSQIGGLARNGIAKLSTGNGGAADPSWQADTGRSWASTLCVQNGSFFAGGYFPTINGTVSPSLAKLDPSSGAVDRSFSAQVGQPGKAQAVARQADGKVVLGGDFYLVDGYPRQNLARFNLDGTLDESWQPAADGPITAIAVQGADIFVAGRFSKVGGQSRNGLAKFIGANSDEADPNWNPNLIGPISSIAVSSTNVFVASNHLLSFGTIVKLSTTGTGQADLAWKPGRFIGDSPFPICSLSADANSVYVAGNFQWVDLTTNFFWHQGLVKLNASGTGEVDLQWGQSFNSPVSAMALADTNLYVARVFEGLARMSTLGAGDVDLTWQPDLLGSHVDVLALGGTNLYIGGALTSASGFTNVTLLRARTTGSGLVDPTWNPNPHLSGYTFSGTLALAPNANNVYVAGDFDIIGGEARSGFALVATTGAPIMRQGLNSTVIIQRNSMDGPEVTHFRITEIQNGALFLSGTFAPVRPGNFITVEQGGTGLHFIGSASSASVTAVSALNSTTDGTGNAATTLTLLSPASSLLRFSLENGLTLWGLPGRSYQIDYTRSLSSPIIWQQFTCVGATGGTLIVPGTRPDSHDRCFFRATLLPELR